MNEGYNERSIDCTPLLMSSCLLGCGANISVLPVTFFFVFCAEQLRLLFQASSYRGTRRDLRTSSRTLSVFTLMAKFFHGKLKKH